MDFFLIRREQCGQLFPSSDTFNLKSILRPLLINCHATQFGVRVELEIAGTVELTLEGIEAVNMMRKEMVKRLSGSDNQGQVKFVLNLFQVAALILEVFRSAVLISG